VLSNSSIPYDDPPLFEAVKAAFLQAHPECGSADQVGVGFGPGLGPYNAILVKVETGITKRVPRRFMGIPVVKLVKTKTKRGWRNAG
jgi:hypothetical protein